MKPYGGTQRVAEAHPAGQRTVIGAAVVGAEGNTRVVETSWEMRILQIVVTHAIKATIIATTGECVQYLSFPQEPAVQSSTGALMAPEKPFSTDAVQICRRWNPSAMLTAIRLYNAVKKA